MKSYNYPEDVSSAEEPILGEHGASWAGFQVNRTAVDSTEGQRLLGKIILAIYLFHF